MQVIIGETSNSNWFISNNREISTIVVLYLLCNDIKLCFIHECTQFAECSIIDIIILFTEDIKINKVQ